MKNPLAILFMLFGVGALLVIAELLVTLSAASLQAAIIPLALVCFIALGCLGSGIILIIADIKYKVPPSSDRSRGNHRHDR